MPIRSMTGFGRQDGAIDDVRWHWEVRSVNGRSLDMRVRLPPGHDMLEEPVRRAVAAHVRRGSINVTLSSSRTAGTTEIRLNEDALRQVLAAARQASEIVGGPAPTSEALLQIKGVLEIAEPDETEDARDHRHGAMLAGLEAALAQVVASRTEEGAKLAAVLSRLLDGNAAEVARRLEDAVRRLMADSQGLDRDRLHQEAVLLASKADIEEELQRLRAHIEAARELLTKDEPIGRKLEFLTQEFNREANTICSKSNDIAITRSGLALKAVIEQMREQVQNIE